MNDNTRALIHEAARGSSESRLHFGQVIGLLVQAGVEAQRRAAQSLEEASDKQIRRFRLAWSCRSCPESCGK